ncbi:hypothetical protein Bbelb_018150 [Branchiostoma belcheri]|nr:hypothetical protein Bbelb_018150 [Branchiostoma belcheri]
MSGQGKAVRPPVSGPDSRQTSRSPSQPCPVQQSGSRGSVRHGNGASDHDKQREDQDTSSHTYEDVDGVKRHATSAESKSVKGLQVRALPLSPFYESLSGVAKARYEDKVAIIGFDPHSLEKSAFQTDFALVPMVKRSLTHNKQL